MCGVIEVGVIGVVGHDGLGWFRHLGCTSLGANLWGWQSWGTWGVNEDGHILLGLNGQCSKK